MVHSGSINFTKLAEVFNKLPNERDKSEALAQCVKSAAKRIGDKEVANGFAKTLSSGLPWGEDRFFKDPNFLRRYQLEFIANATPHTPVVADIAATSKTPSSNSLSDAGSSVPKSACDPDVIERIDACLKKMDFKELTKICAQNCKSKDSEKYLKHIFIASQGTSFCFCFPVLSLSSHLFSSFRQATRIFRVRLTCS